MRICLLSKNGNSSNWLYEGVHDSLKQLGVEMMDIAINQARNEPPPHWVSIPSLLPSDKKPADATILKQIQAFEPDQIWFLSYSGIPFLADNGPELKTILEPRGGKIIYWTGDLPDAVHENTYLGSLIDYIFLNDMETREMFKERWKNTHVYYMPHGTIADNHYNSTKIYKHDVTFLGRRQSQDPRYAFRNTVLDAFAKETDLFENDQTTTPSDVHALYQTSKIVLGVSWNNNALLYTSDRIYNAMGSGSFCLHFYFPGMERIVENRTHLVWFKTIEEGVDLAHYYLEHDTEREAIALKGFELVKENHTYLHRVQNILDIVAHKTNTFSGFL